MNVAAPRFGFTFSPERRHFMEAYIILEEYIKEMCAILDTRCRLMSPRVWTAGVGDAVDPDELSWLDEDEAFFLSVGAAVMPDVA